MTVYVDDMEAEFGRMKMCHMVADTRAELLGMADAIGVQRRWLQHRGRPTEHFDISKGKRALAVERGAVEVSMRDLVHMTVLRRDKERMAAYVADRREEQGVGVDG